MENTSRPTTSDHLESHSNIVEDNTLTPELSDQVFKNELIQDRIFNYIFNSGNVHIRKYGLVKRYWLDYLIRRIQRTSASPPIDLSFEYWEQSKEDQKRKGKEYQVHKFLETWTTVPDAGSRVPFFNLKFTRPSDVAMKIDKVQDLSKCLVQCGNGLRRLDINLDYITNDEVNDILTRLDLGQLDVPNLKDLHVLLPNKNTQVVIALLLAPILSGCKRLTFLSLNVPVSTRNIHERRTVIRFISSPAGAKKVEYLPETIEKVNFKVAMTSQLLSNLFLENSLPNLTELQLQIGQSMDSADIVSRILVQFSHQLKIFEVLNCNSSRDESSFIRFPVMATLEELSVFGFSSELEEGMEQPFPVLEILNLVWNSDTTTRKWTTSFQFNSVHELRITIFGIQNNNIELSQQLHVSFPYLQKLYMNGIRAGMEDGFMQNIFRYMTNLCELSIYDGDSSEIVGASTWDAIILGVSPEYARNLAKSPREQWDLVNLNNFREPSRSIMNLSNLTALSLESTGVISKDDLLISDVSFHFAFLRMPNLRNLALDRGFGASKKMVEEWKRSGRIFYGYERDESEDIDNNVSGEEQHV